MSTAEFASVQYANMDLTNLSSNWKKLQSNLKAQDASPSHPDPTLERPAKRKRVVHTSAAPHSSLHQRAQTKSGPKTAHDKFKTNGVKRQRFNGQVDRNNAKVLAPEAAPGPRDQQFGSPFGIKSKAGAGKYVALDCEMVGIGLSTTTTNSASTSSSWRERSVKAGVTIPPHAVPLSRAPDNPEETHSLLARVSIVSYTLEALYDAYVLPPRDTPIVNYRTQYSGITPWHLNPAANPNTPKPFEVVQREVAALLRGRVLVGHALEGDLQALNLKGAVPRGHRRDTSLYTKYRAIVNGKRYAESIAARKSERSAASGAASGAGAGVTEGRDTSAVRAKAKLKSRTPGLRRLAQEILGWEIQGDAKRGHSSLEDARAAMELFKIEKRGFEAEAKRLYGASASASAGLGSTGPAGRSARLVTRNKGVAGLGTDRTGVDSGESDSDEAAAALAELETEDDEETEEYDDDEDGNGNGDEDEEGIAEMRRRILLNSVSARRSGGGLLKKKRKKKKTNNTRRGP